MAEVDTRSQWQKDFDERSDKIASALMEKKWYKGNELHWYFDLTMKATGNHIRVMQIKHGPHRSCGHWRGRYINYRVVGDGIEGAKMFNSLFTLARAIAAGIIK